MVGLALLLVACNKNPFEVTISRCPAVAVVGDAGIYTAFAGNDEMVDSVMYHASILNVDITCKESATVVADISFDLDVRRGPAFEGETVTIPYFVVVLKDNNLIVTKKTFDVTLAVGEDGARSREIIRQNIPTIEQAREYNYEVLIGIVLDPADIAFNMRR